MIIIQKIIASLSPIVIFASLEFMIRGFLPIWYGIPINSAIVFLTVLKLTNWKIRNREFWGFLISPIIFILSATGVLIIIEGQAWTQSIIITSTIIYALYLEHIFKFFHQPPLYQPYSLENTSMHANLISLFYTAATIFGLKMLLGLKTWQMIAPFSLIIILLTIQTFWIHKILITKNKHFVLLVIVIILETYWAIHFLPTHHLVSALLLTTIFYALLNSSRLYLTGVLTTKVAKKHLLVVGIIFFLILTSSRWI